MNQSQQSTTEKKKRKPYIVSRNPEGRPAGSPNCSRLRWEVIIFDKETNTFRQGKFCTVKQLNEAMGLKLNTDYCSRLLHRDPAHRVDPTMSKGPRSFLAKYGHISLKKIDEPIVKPTVAEILGI